jgi:hypothetical protein
VWGCSQPVVPVIYFEANGAINERDTPGMGIFHDRCARRVF